VGGICGRALAALSADPLEVGGKISPLDRFMPQAEVNECVSLRVAAPSASVMAAAQSLDLFDIPLIRALFASRARLMGLGHSAQLPAVLAEETGSYVIFGAVTKPWEGNVVFQPLEPSVFLAFADPGFAKIAWTLRVESEGTGSRCITETRVVTTSADARQRFRRYWAVFSPGILLIRQRALRSVKAAAERL